MRFDTLDAVQADQLDFVPRERRSRVLRTIFAFVVAIALIFIMAFAPPLSKFAAYLPFVAIFILALLCLFTAHQEQTTLDLATAAEYQSLLYSQALSLGASFSLIVRREGSIVYASDGLRAVFPQFDYAESKALEGVFEQGLVRKADRERIMGAIYSSTPERLVFTLSNQYQDHKDYIITVEPMARPAGYSMVRGREYLGKRSGLQAMPDALSATSADKLEHLLATTPTAHYTTDAFGRFEYVNPAFEQLFGYAPGDIVASKLSLHHLVFSLGDNALTEESALTDYNGSAVILNKQSGREPATLRQSVIRDAAGKTVGATGSLTTARVTA